LERDLERLRDLRLDLERLRDLRLDLERERERERDLERVREGFLTHTAFRCTLLLEPAILRE